MKHPTIKFTVECEMNRRWIPHFLGMLKMMQSLGGLGGSRWVCLYSDGDGDFRPKFEYSQELPKPAEPLKPLGADHFGPEVHYDAG